MKYQFEMNEKIEDCEMYPLFKPDSLMGDCDFAGGGDRGDALRPNWCPLVEVQDE